VSCTTARPLGRLMNLLGGSLGYYGSYSLAQQQWIVPYMFGGMPGSSLSAMADSDLVLCFGSSPSETRQGGAVSHHDWVRGREYTKGKVYIIDPRMNDSAMGHSAQWLPINPGTDAALVSAIAHELIVNDQVDHEFLDTYCVGFDESTMPESAKGQNKSYTDYIMGTGYDMVEKTPEWAAPLCGISADRIRSLTEEIAAAEHMFVVQGWGPQRRSNGEMTAMAIMVLPLLVGQVGLPGTNNGVREGSNGVGLQGLPAGDNPVTTSISVFSMVDAIDHGTEMTEVADGVRGKEKLDTNIKFVWNYAGNCITNQNSDINHVHDVMVDDTKCEFVVGIDTVMCDSLKYSDIILPDLFRFEQVSMIGTGGDDGYMIAGQPCTERKFECRTNYEWVAELAEIMGVGEEFSEGKTEEDWIKELYEASREKNPDLPTYEDAMAMGVYTVKGNKKIALEAFRADPVANPLKTPSGKIEIYSEALDQYIQTHEFADDDFVAPVPVYATEWYGVETTTDEYPLVCSGFHYRGRLHSSWGFDEQLKAANPQEAWINPVDAEERGIAQGDTIRVKNQFGEIELLAKVTGRTTPGVVCISQGAWHDADMNGDRVDKGGSINTLTTLRPSPLAKGNPQHTNICQVTKA
ncbi:MAG: molybdopterin-dependent oxidoreductase, partial [Coriobacteriaceae bacterium]|nr:molybdopterin-dependent oxidoreductase [Coriobacteriaceae bacterium]